MSPQPAPAPDPDPPEPDIEELWRRICAGEEGAMEVLRRLIEETCSPKLRQLGAPPNLVPDLLSDTLTSVWVYARNRDGGGRSLPGTSGPFREFLKFRARSVLTDHRRASRGPGGRDWGEDPSEASGHSSGPVAEAVMDEEFDAYRECRETMPGNHRAVLSARHERGLSTGETATEMRIPKGTVAMRLHYATIWLMNCLRTKGAVS